MGNKRLAKKVDKLEGKAEKFASKASKKAGKLADRASERAEELSSKAKQTVGVEEEDSGGRKGLWTLLLAGITGAAFYFKKKRDQELDEALWEEPRAL